MAAAKHPPTPQVSQGQHPTCQLWAIARAAHCQMHQGKATIPDTIGSIAAELEKRCKADNRGWCNNRPVPVAWARSLDVLINTAGGGRARIRTKQLKSEHEAAAYCDRIGHRVHCLAVGAAAGQKFGLETPPFRENHAMAGKSATTKGVTLTNSHGRKNLHLQMKWAEGRMFEYGWQKYLLAVAVGDEDGAFDGLGAKPAEPGQGKNHRKNQRKKEKRDAKKGNDK
jgi:hypothetical protein